MCFTSSRFVNTNQSISSVIASAENQVRSGLPAGGRRIRTLGPALSRQRDRTRIESQSRQASCRCNSTLPLCGSFGSEDPQRRSRNEMALKVEGVVDGGMHAEKALGRSSRLEELQLALSSSHRPTRILRPIILPEPLLMRTGQSETSESRGVGAQFV